MPDYPDVRALSGWTDPEALFLALEAECDDVFWLDVGGNAAAGWSFVGTGERSQLPGSVRVDSAADVEARIPFVSGWVGWCDYESGARAAGAPTAPTAVDAGGSWLRVTKIAAFDHATREVWVSYPGNNPEDQLASWSDFVGRAHRSLPPVSAAPGESVAEARHTPAEYGELIARCRELIRAGIAYQLCLTTQFAVPGSHDAVAVYRRLRSATPAHHGGFVRIGGRTLLSASPEQFLRADGGIVRTKPIKGTRPRSDDPLTDVALAAELTIDPKERAENVMIVDLMRNDLSQVCVPGTIRVDGLWVVESYPAVHQLVSTISGTVAPGTTVGALLAATFPAGSMTGAPKLSAMTQLHELERHPRGIYSGCFGYIADSGTVDLAMVIRSIVIDADGAAIGAGGGITWGSIPLSEVTEVLTKARAPLAALGASLPASWASDILN